jgi:hypothetical protein
MGNKKAERVDFAGDSIGALRARVTEALRDDPLLAAAADSVLGDIEQCWDCHGGLEGDGFDRLVGAVLGPVNGILTGPEEHRADFVRSLVHAWQTVRGTLRWA